MQLKVEFVIRMDAGTHKKLCDMARATDRSRVAMIRQLINTAGNAFEADPTVLLPERKMFEQCIDLA